jgi:hypothetical protein
MEFIDGKILGKGRRSIKDEVKVKAENEKSK